ncbi:hypothetical protein PENSPDRAFT_209063 [Peniophora sp. CONT]|nr:hypothetical protein PENSPDRAFT_209063 [Peniophora sp. CONT]
MLTFAHSIVALLCQPNRSSVWGLRGSHLARPAFVRFHARARARFGTWFVLHHLCLKFCLPVWAFRAMT